jgi:hypothetical protein
MATKAAAEAVVPRSCWTGLHLPDCPLVIERRELGQLATIVRLLAARAPFERNSAGPPEQAVKALGLLPSALRVDILALANRFAAFLAIEGVRLRLEAVNTDACRKIHADYTDLRLITTYAGPGTDYLPRSAKPEERNLQRLATGDIGLFKGRLYADGHEPCLHRSPPIATIDETRLVLVIDSPLDEVRAIKLQASAGAVG